MLATAVLSYYYIILIPSVNRILRKSRKKTTFQLIQILSSHIITSKLTQLNMGVQSNQGDVVTRTIVCLLCGHRFEFASTINSISLKVRKWISVRHTQRSSECYWCFHHDTGSTHDLCQGHGLRHWWHTQRWSYNASLILQFWQQQSK